MRVRSITLTLFLFAAALSVRATDLSLITQTIPIGDSSVRVSVYEKPGSEVVLFVPHFNEQIAVSTAKAALEKHGGRLVVIESVDDRGRPARRTSFTIGGTRFSIDPNRIYTVNGRGCGNPDTEVMKATETFSRQILKLLSPDGGGPKMLVAVHNNTDSTASKSSLAAPAFAATISQTEFADQASGVYLSNLEPDPDNFVIVSDPGLLPYFASRSFSVVVQKPAALLGDTRCSVDDGSMSVYSAQNGITYICLEADAITGAARQQEMLEAVYQLAEKPGAAGGRP